MSEGATLWTALIVGTVSVFLLNEFFALSSGRITLSRYTVQMCRKHPIIPFVIGLIVGGLAVHFWLPWCPDDCVPSTAPAAVIIG